jgi:hypothetical protein
MEGAPHRGVFTVTQHVRDHVSSDFGVTYVRLIDNDAAKTRLQ